MPSNMMTKKDSSRLYSILVPACSGKSTLFNKIKRHRLKFRKGRPLILIDIDEITFQTDDSEGLSKASSTQEHAFPLLKETVDETLRKYPKYRVLIISSNPELLKYLNVSQNKTRIYVQSLMLFLEGISPLLCCPEDESNTKGNAKEEDNSDSEDDRKDRPPQKPLPIPGQVTKLARTSSSLSSSDLDVADTLPTALSSKIALMTGHFITVTDDNGHESTPVSFKAEVTNICNSRDRIMQEFSDSYGMYTTYEELFDKVVADFKIEFKH